MASWNWHIKRTGDPKKSDAYSPTLCGREDSGQYAYMTLEPNERIPSDTEGNVCRECVEKHYSTANVKHGGTDATN